MIRIKDVYGLKVLILKEGVSFSGFAKKIGMSRSNLFKILRNEKATASSAKKILDGLEKDFNEIFLVS